MMGVMTDTSSATTGTFRPTIGFGVRLRIARREYTNYGQKEMAAALGVTTQAYSAWEAGRNTPRELPKVAAKLEKVTNVDRTWFLGWADTQPSDYKGQVSQKQDAKIQPRVNTPRRSRPSNRSGNTGPKSSR